MTQVMHHVILFLSAFSCVFCNTDDIGISVTPSLDAGPINWKQTITITCTWTPGKFKFADILVGAESIFNHPVYADIVNLEDPEARLYFTQDPDVGTAELIIKDITKEDESQYTCSVSRIGPGGSVTLEVLEPPTAGVTGLTATPDFTSVHLTWEAVEGATNYNVAWRAAGTEAWTDVDVAGTEHTFEGLNVASDYEAKATASNPAGIRDGIEPAETTFTTKDNRPPHPVGGLNVHEADYNATTITLSWELQDNIDENRIITGITAAAVKEGAAEGDPAVVIDPQELGADATSVTFELPGAGDYVFTITTNNDFSAGVETSMTEIHTVKETTDPPTPEPTTPEPTKKPTTEPKKEPTTAAKEEPEVEIDIGDGGETIVCGDTRAIQPLPNTQAILKCTKHDDSAINPADIVWSFQAGDADAVEQTQIIASEIGEVANDNKSSILTIKNVDANSVGFWKCRHGDGDTREFCTYSVELTGAATGENSGTALVCSGTVILAALIASLLH